MVIPDLEKMGRKAFRCWCQRVGAEGVTFWKRPAGFPTWIEMGPVSFSLQFYAATKYPQFYDDTDFAAVFPAAVQKESDR